MFTAEEVMQLMQSLVWLLAGVGVFIVGMNFMSDALEKSAGNGMKNLLGKISNNRFSGVGIGAGVTAIIQSSSAATGVVITMVGTGVLPLDMALFIVLGANIGTCVTALLASVGANANSKRVAFIHFTFNVTKYTRREVKDNLVFSEGISEKLAEMHALLHKQYALVKRIIVDKEYGLMGEADALEEEIDGMRRDLVAEHILRLSQGKCRPENNTVFINLVSNLERIGDHINFIAHSIED